MPLMRFSPDLRGILLLLAVACKALHPLDFQPFIHEDNSAVIHLHSERIQVNERLASQQTTFSTESTHVHTDLHPQTSTHTQWLVHVKAPITVASKQRLQDALSPYIVGAYVPHNTFLVAGPAPDRDEGAFVARLRSAPHVLHVQEMEPGFKMVAPMWSDVNLHATAFVRSASLRGDHTPASLSTLSDTVLPAAPQFLSSPTTMRHSAASQSDSADQAQAQAQPQPVYQSTSTGDVVLRVQLAANLPHGDGLRSLLAEWSGNLRSAVTASVQRGVEAMEYTDFLPSATEAERHYIRPFSSNVHDQYYAGLQMELAEVPVANAELRAGGRVEVVVRAQDALRAVHWLAHRREVHWVERVPLFYLQNKFARDIIQADSPSHVVWDHGLHGEGEIVAVGDTGIDHDLCFFYDPNQAISFGGPANFNHRKIVRYVTLADSSDDLGGHGTHVSGSLVGDVLTDDANVMAALSPFNGMAPKAKLAFYDFKTTHIDALNVPQDVENQFFADALLNSNAHIFSNSWGSPDGTYTTFSRDVDHFFYSRASTVGVFAAGNYGDDGYFSISNPGVAKNVLTVGASMSTSASFSESGAGVGIDFPPNLAGTYEAARADFGPDFNRVTIDHVPAVMANPILACSAVSNAAALAGNVAIVRRGDCPFTQKVKFMQDAGARLVLVANSDQPMSGMRGDGIIGIHIPTVMIPKPIGDAIIAQLSSTTGNTTVLVSTPKPSDDPLKNERMLAGFSSRGPTTDMRLKPDVVAPGHPVVSAKSDGNPASHKCEADDLMQMSGTSMATPIAAGAAAMVRQYLREGWYPTGAKNANNAISTPEGSVVKAMLVHATVPIGGWVDSTGKHQPGPTPVPVLPPPSVFQGFGRVQLDHVLKFADSPASAALVPALFQVNPILHDTGKFSSYCFKVKATPEQPTPFLRATLVWMDPAPDLTTPLLLVNNLDLVLYSAQGEVWVGNQQHFSDSTGDHTMLDSLNNVEQVTLDDSNHRFSGAADGVVVTVVVRATYLPVFDQAFALVVTGTFEGQLPISQCGARVFCPNNCGGSNGECNTDGTCSCTADFFGADCSQQASGLARGGSASWSGEGSVKSGAWSYYYFDVVDSDLSEGLSVIMTRTSTFGDPDLYVSFNQFPDLHHAAYVSTACEPCSPGKSSSVIIPRDQLTVGRWRVGVNGYCCADSRFTLQVTSHVEPPPPSWFRYVWIAAAMLLFLTGALAYIFVRRARASRPDGYVAAVDQPARGGNAHDGSGGVSSSGASSGGYVLGSLGTESGSAAGGTASGASSAGAAAMAPSTAAAAATNPGDGMVHAGGSSGWSRLPQQDESQYPGSG